MKLIWLAVIVIVGWRWLVGRWPWEKRSRVVDRGAAARALLGVVPGADRAQIMAAHRALLAQVHPDRGGTSEAVHAADAARDVLLAEAAHVRG
jgi:DnaJ homolog subfamily C member 19